MTLSENSLNSQCQSLSVDSILSLLIKTFKEDDITFSTSLSHEDQIILDHIAKGQYKFRIFFIDTGRHFQETWDVFQKTLEHYGSIIQVAMPDNQKISKVVHQKGPNFFYSSIDNRRECCYLRKVIPLENSLKNKKVWLTGIRKAQSITRINMNQVQWDNHYQLFKVHPLLNWSIQQVEDYIQENDIPVNSLYKKGFKSIGCQPCTRAIKTGEDVRAGRWWWESPEHKECGLHKNDSPNKKDKK